MVIPPILHGFIDWQTQRGYGYCSTLSRLARQRKLNSYVNTFISNDTNCDSECNDANERYEFRGRFHLRERAPIWKAIICPVALSACSTHELV